MKKSRFTDSQIVAVLKEGDAGVPVAQLVVKEAAVVTIVVDVAVVTAVRAVIADN